MYISVVTFSTQDNNKLLEQLNQHLKELLNGANADLKCLIRLEITI